MIVITLSIVIIILIITVTFKKKYMCVCKYNLMYIPISYSYFILYLVHIRKDIGSNILLLRLRFMQLDWILVFLKFIFYNLKKNKV